MNSLPFYDDVKILWYKKNKIRRYGDKVYSNFWRLDVLENGVEYKYFTVISISSWLVYDSKYYLQIYLDNCAYNVADNQIIDYVDDNIFETDKD